MSSLRKDFDFNPENAFKNFSLPASTSLEEMNLNACDRQEFLWETEEFTLAEDEMLRRWRDILNFAGVEIGEKGALLIAACLRKVISCVNSQTGGKKIGSKENVSGVKQQNEVKQNSYHTVSTDKKYFGKKPPAMINLAGAKIGPNGAAAILAALASSSDCGSNTVDINLASNNLNTHEDLSFLHALAFLLANEEKWALPVDPSPLDAARLLSSTQFDPALITHSKVKEHKKWLNAVENCNGPLDTLSLAHNDIGDVGASIIAHSLHEKTCTLTNLNLSACHLGDNSASMIASVLTESSSCLIELDLSGNHIRAEGVFALLSAVFGVSLESDESNVFACMSRTDTAITPRRANETLTTLHLAYNHLGPKGGSAIKAASAAAGKEAFRSALTALDLCGCALQQKGIESVADALEIGHSSSLRVLNIGFNVKGFSKCNRIIASFARRSSKQVKNNQSGVKNNDEDEVVNHEASVNNQISNYQASIDVTGNDLGDSGIALIIESIGSAAKVLVDDVHQGFNSLSCCWNGIGALGLGSNGIGDEGAALLSQVIETSPYPDIHSIVLSENSIGDVGAEILANAIGRNLNSALEYLDLSKNEIGHAGLNSLRKACELNPTLQALPLDGNPFFNITPPPREKVTLDDRWCGYVLCKDNHEEDFYELSALHYLKQMLLFNVNWKKAPEKDQEWEIAKNRDGTVAARQAINDYERKENKLPDHSQDVLNFVKRNWRHKDHGGRGNDQLPLHSLEIKSLLQMSKRHENIRDIF
eukprot:g5051.t1